MCGDHYVKSDYRTTCQGSPPHVRGPPIFSFIPFSIQGITPACAGTTSSTLIFCVHDRDHPRMCGDHSTIINPFSNNMGSPPHVRGPLNRYFIFRPSDGITPACAGTTNIMLQGQGAGWDHPRMCGDHDHLLHVERTRLGSPPHVRGPPTRALLTNAKAGITPACAGTTTTI